VKSRILLVEDEIDFQETLTEILILQGYEVFACNSIASFEQCYRPSSFDLAILDRTLPDGDGLDILRRIRMEASVPVLILTGLGHVEEKILGLDADADHYLVKPVDVRELLSIIKRALRRDAPVAQKPSLWTLDAHAWKLQSPEGVSVALTHRESVLLKCFSGKSGRVIHRDMIISTLGFDPLVYDVRRLETMFSRLRKKIEQAGANGFDLQTVYGVGYALHTQLIEGGELLGDRR
jgi:DNA-binding response OmpR family regulator